MTHRQYNHEKDREAVRRIFVEVGWLREEDPFAFEWFIDEGQGWVADVNGEPECIAISAPGTVRHLQEELPFNAVTAVATSRVGRKRGLASELTALAVASAAAEGAAVAGLGMFDQGFYNRLGFGTGAYVRRSAFDPHALAIPSADRAPRRLTKDDWPAMHESRLQRRRAHGSCTLTPASTHFETALSPHGFGLGFFDGPGGTLSHHVWLAIRSNVEFGPYRVKWMAWRTKAQLLELLGVLKGLGDQVHSVAMIDPPGIQMQSLIRHPFRRARLTSNSDYEEKALSFSWWQMRICDLAACLVWTKLRGDEARFNLRLTDPIADFLPEDAPWRGVGGEYVVTLGPSSGAEPGADAALPTMTASVNAFTRLWLGVGSATGLVFTDDLDAPPELLERLDCLLRLPNPQPDWDF